MQPDPSTLGPLKERSVILWGEAAALKPTMNRDHIQIRIGGESILVNVLPRGPAIQDACDGVICCHDQYFMTNSVIGQYGQHGD